MTTHQGSSSSRSGFVLGCLTGSFSTALLLAWWYQSNSSRKKMGEEEELRRLHQLSKSSALRNGNPNVSSLSLRGGVELSSSFLTSLLGEMWDYLNVAGAATIRASVEPYFADLPGPLKTLRFTKVDLGTSPIRMDNLVVRNIQDGMIQIDFDMIWNGHCDMQLQAEQNSMIKFGVKELKLSGPFSLWLKPLTNSLPIISGISYAFINPPHVDLKFTGLAQVADWAVVTNAVRDAINASLLCLVLPNRRVYKMQSNNNYLDTYQPPVGICRVTALWGRGFVIEKKLIGKDDIPDVYLNITLGSDPNVWRTRTIRDNLEPIWKESKDFVLHDCGQKLRFHAWDEDKGPLDPDDDLGKASVLIQEILMAKKRRLELELLHSKTHKGMDAFVTMGCELLQWTTDLSSLSNQPQLQQQQDRQSLEQTIIGLLVIIVNRAYNIPKPREMAASFVKVVYGDQQFQTGTVVDYPGYSDGLNPLYERAFEIPIKPGMPTTGNGAQVTLELFNAPIPSNTNQNDSDSQRQSPKVPAEELLGSLLIDFESLRSIPEHTVTETKPIGNDGASIEFRVSLCGVQPSPISSSSSSSSVPHSALQPGATPPRILPTSDHLMNGVDAVARKIDEEDEPPPPIGRVRVTVVKGRGLKISDELFNIDIPDTYCHVLFGSSSDIWKTSVQRNTCMPVWNESKEYDLQDHSQVIALEVHDKNEREYDPDIEVGAGKTTVGNILLAGGSLDLELNTKQGQPTKVFITLRCELL